MMTDHDSFIRAICEEPDCDVRRLAFADFLQDNDQPQRATFIRNQIELHGKTVVCEVPIRAYCDGKPNINPDWGTNYTVFVRHGSIPALSPGDIVALPGEFEKYPNRVVDAVRIQGNWTELGLNANTRPLPPNVIDAWRAQELREECGRLWRERYQSWFQEKDSAGGTLLGNWLQPMWVDERVSRGFVRWIRTDHNEFMRSVRSGMFRWHPLSQVWFTGLYPDARTNGEFTWWNPKRTHRRYESRFRNEPPQRLYDIMESEKQDTKTRGISFDTEAKAVAALSRAAVIHGRRKAGLPIEFARAT